MAEQQTAPSPPASFDELVSTLRAVAEPTRLRLIALLNRAELTVTEITQVVGQSQPRISRHLKLLVDAGLMERTPRARSSSTACPSAAAPPSWCVASPSSCRWPT